MLIKVIAYGIAKDILGSKEIEMEVDTQTKVSTFKAQLIKKYPAFAALTSLMIAVDEEYQSADYLIPSGAEIVLIPPVAGG